MISKELQICKSPIIGLQYIAYPLCVLLNYDECLSWFYSNYIQLFWSNNLKLQLTFFPNKFESIPVLFQEVFKKSTLKNNMKGIHNFIKDCIDNDKYIYSKFDEFYIPNRINWGKKHFSHDFLLYGYNSDKEEYSILGFNEKFEFVTTQVNYNIFEKSFFSYTNKNDLIHLIKKNNDVKYSFDVQLVYEMLSDYLNSVNTSKKYRMYGHYFPDRVFGMSIYNLLTKYYNKLIKNNIDNDIRPIHIFYEHKKCMVMRLKYMISKKYLSDNLNIVNRYKTIEDKIISFRNLHMKYYISQKKSCLKRIIDELPIIENEEKILINDILTELHFKSEGIAAKK